MHSIKILSLVILSVLLFGCSNYVYTTPKAMEKIAIGNTVRQTQRTLHNRGRLLFLARQSGDEYEVRAYTPGHTFSTYCLLFKNGKLHSVSLFHAFSFPDVPAPYSLRKEKAPSLEWDNHLAAVLDQMEQDKIDLNSHDFSKQSTCGVQRFKKRLDHNNAEALMWAPIAILFAPCTITIGLPVVTLYSPFYLTEITMTKYRWSKIKPGMSILDVQNILGDTNLKIKYNEGETKASSYEVHVYEITSDDYWLNIAFRNNRAEWIYIEPKGSGNYGVVAR